MADLLGIGTGIQAGVDAGKAIYGAVQAKKGEAQMLSAIEDIQYTRPEEYQDIMNILGQRVSSVGTRREAAEERVREQTATSMSGISQLADSPVAALGAYGGMKQREQQAIADLGIQYEGIKDEAMLGLTKGLEMGAGYSDKEQYYNDMYKQMIKANIGASKMGAGTNMMWGGLEGMASTALDYAGTKYLDNIYNPTPNGAGSTGPGATWTNPNWSTPSIPELGENQVTPATNLGKDPYS